MSRAFVNEDSLIAAGLPALPDRPVSPGRNLVTRRGLQLIEAALHGHQAALRTATDAEDREAAAREARELRYWTARRASAELAEPDPSGETVVFGAAVTVAFEDGHEVRYRIVGEDEGEPETGHIAWTTPVARALMGAGVGDTRVLPRGEVEILEIDTASE